VENRNTYGRKNDLRYTAKDITLAVNMVKELENSIDMMYYLMNKSSNDTFVLMLITADNIELKNLLKKEKRDTDIVYDVGDDECICAMICQETKVDGGYRFAERIIRNITLDKGDNIYCAELEVRTTKYSSRDIIFRIVDAFVKARQVGKSGEIIFKSIY
jgi:GGDEF domain-containing protein